MQLRDYQQNAIDSLREAMAGKEKPVLSAPTGSGKTLIASEIFSLARAKHKRVVFVVPFLSLINQTWKAFERAGIDGREMGIIQGDHALTDWRHPVQIASAQTLERRPVLPEADIVIFDECHINRKIYQRWMNEAPDVRFIGLSATPWASGMDALWSKMIIVSTLSELIEQGHLSSFKYYAPAQPDLSKVRTRLGDYVESDLELVMGQADLIADIVNTWKEKAYGRPTFCFCVNRRHAQEVQAQFLRAGIPAGYVDAYTKVEEREDLVEQLRTGHLMVICNIGTMTTGVDAPFVNCIILARPTKSEMLYIQIVGRGLRTDPASGKTDCLARGTLILTDKGEVPIESITLDHKLWDGINFVSHGGAICKGVSKVITYDGITATPDHLVMTINGWEAIEIAANNGRRITQSAIGGKPIRVSGNNRQNNRKVFLESISSCQMSSVRKFAYDEIPQYQEKTGNKSLHTLQCSTFNYCSEMALSALSSAERSLRKFKKSALQGLWWAWNKISFFQRQRSIIMDYRQPWVDAKIYGFGQNKQQWSLRAGKYKMGSQNYKFQQQSKIGWKKSSEIHCVSSELSSNKIRGLNFISFHSGGDDGKSDNRKMERAVLQAEREVWDIINVGPLQRFTANGKLVHNCVILDHSNTALSLGRPDDIHYDDFRSGKQAKSGDREKKEREAKKPNLCPHCKFVLLPKETDCPSCGFQFPPPVSDVAVSDGELIELGPKGKRGQHKRDDKQAWYSGFLWIARDKGYSKGWAAHSYKKAFGVWPRGLDETPRFPDAVVFNYVKSRNIAWAKAQQKIREAGGQHV